ncbi:uncharacterized protein LOC123509711 [Portunus trituberculatus]|uniref:uncharacterized protein LOC123509711 n=1 Tax=Portunus trituberculatus TaxID=210409 RepID=UPI001E1D1780|nr:uncharacterized protein LOC123509711 [Portunus trituberculatus]XP_045120154.1 uncharacterized protein LOC123509711 [Portunus trituberculatus]
MANIKKNGVRILVEEKRNGNDVKSKNDEDEGKDNKKHDNFYMRVYDDAVAKKTAIDNTIIEQTCEVGDGRVGSLARVMGGPGQGAASHHAAHASALQTIHHQRQHAHKRYSSLVNAILSHEKDIKAQEERKRESELLLEREAAECGLQQEEVARLQRLIHATSSITAATTAKVATYSTYKEYVERSVVTFGSEAATVEGVCGRFRDLLTLRLQLLLKVNLAFRQLHHARRELLVFVQSEKEREGEALLKLYRERAASWTSSRNLSEMEARLAALQTASTHTHTHLTRVRLALVNIYSVARAYQHSLPPLGPKAATGTVLKRLHNFLLDAMTVTTTARAATHPASLRPSASSIPAGRGSAPPKKDAKDSKDTQSGKTEAEEGKGSAGPRRSSGRRQGRLTREGSRKTMKVEPPGEGGDKSEGSEKGQTPKGSVSEGVNVDKS